MTSCLRALLAAHGAVRVSDRLRTGEAIELPAGDTLGAGLGNRLVYRSAPFRDPTELIARARLVLGGLLHRMPPLNLAPVLQGADPELEGSEFPSEMTGGRAFAILRGLEAAGIGDARVVFGHFAHVVVLHPGSGTEGNARIAAAERLAPYFAAIFANSPLKRGQVTGWVSRRIAERTTLDPRRVGLVGFHPERDPAEALVDFGMRATYLPEHALHPAPFAHWMKRRGGGSVTLDDWVRHLDALDSPVQPRGGLELRITDALDARWLPVPLLLWWALLWLGSPRRWFDLPTPRLIAIAERGVRIPEVRAVAGELFDSSLTELEASTDPAIPPHLAQVVREFRARYLDCGRVPADDLIDRTQGREASTE